jgi:hypothetical protein
MRGGGRRTGLHGDPPTAGWKSTTPTGGIRSGMTPGGTTAMSTAAARASASAMVRVGSRPGMTTTPGPGGGYWSSWQGWGWGAMDRPLVGLCLCPRLSHPCAACLRGGPLPPLCPPDLHPGRRHSLQGDALGLVRRGGWRTPCRSWKPSCPGDGRVGTGERRARGVRNRRAPAEKRVTHRGGARADDGPGGSVDRPGRTERRGASRPRGADPSLGGCGPPPERPVARRPGGPPEPCRLPYGTEDPPLRRRLRARGTVLARDRVRPPVVVPRMHCVACRAGPPLRSVPTDGRPAGRTPPSRPFAPRLPRRPPGARRPGHLRLVSEPGRRSAAKAGRSERHPRPAPPIALHPLPGASRLPRCAANRLPGASRLPRRAASRLGASRSQPGSEPAGSPRSQPAPRSQQAPQARSQPAPRSQQAPQARSQPAPRSQQAPQARSRPAPRSQQAPQARSQPAPRSQQAPQARSQPAPRSQQAPQTRSSAPGRRGGG